MRKERLGTSSGQSLTFLYVLCHCTVHMSHNPYAPPKANVEDPPTSPSTAARLYSPWQLTVASFLGSPMAAAWFAAANFKALGRRLEAQRTLIWGALGTVVVLGISYVLPDSVPNSVLPIAYSAAIQAVADRVF